MGRQTREGEAADRGNLVSKKRDRPKRKQKDR